jgi:hypothetical protein
MMEPTTQPEPRWGWLALAALGGLFTLLAVALGLWALGETVRTGTGSQFQVLTGTAGAGVFWAWVTGGAWKRAREPEPDPLLPAPVPRRVAFVVANVVLAVVVTGLLAGGIWFELTSAREAARTDVIRTRVEVAAREAGLTVDDVRRLAPEWRAWLATSGVEGTDEPDPLAAVLAVEGATVADVAVGEDRAAILFRPDTGPPCVVLDIDELDIASTRQTRRC